MTDSNHIRKETLKKLREHPSDIGLSLASAEIFTALYQDRTHKKMFVSHSFLHAWQSTLARYGLTSRQQTVHAPLAHATGYALAQKIDSQFDMTYCIMSREELDTHTLEELNLPATHHLSNVCCLILDHSSSLDTLAPALSKWHVIEVDGHNIEHVKSAVREAMQAPQPTAIIAHVISGKGVSFFEHTHHQRTITEHEYQKALREL